MKVQTVRAMIWAKKKISRSKIYILPNYEQTGLKTAIVKVLGRAKILLKSKLLPETNIIYSLCICQSRTIDKLSTLIKVQLHGLALCFIGLAFECDNSRIIVSRTRFLIFMGLILNSYEI